MQVHNSLAMLTIGLLGSEEQKTQLLPKMASLEHVAAWALTEPSNGSDASALTTSAKKVPSLCLYSPLRGRSILPFLSASPARGIFRRVCLGLWCEVPCALD